MSLTVEHLSRFGESLLWYTTDRRFMVLPKKGGYRIVDSRSGRTVKVRTLREARITIAATRAFDLRFTKGGTEP